MSGAETAHNPLAQVASVESRIIGIAPEITDETRAFWEGAQRDALMIDRCNQCDRYVFPPTGVCRFCRSQNLTAQAVTSTGMVYSFTVNHKAWFPGCDVPFVLALVDFPEGFRVAGRMRKCDPDDVTIGMSVRMAFATGSHGVKVPAFEPTDAS